MLQVKSFVFGPFQTNTYVLSFIPSSSGAGVESIMIVDPACSHPYERQMLLDYVQRQSVHSHPQVQIVATHGHLDHLWGAKWATEQWGVPVLVHEADIPMIQAMQQQYDLFGINMSSEQFPMVPLTEDRPALPDRIPTRLQIIHTPGHTPGSVCFYFPEEKVLLSGDTLFRMGYGRTDLPGGNTAQLLDSLERLFTLPADTKVYCGHGEPTTIGGEAR